LIGAGGDSGSSDAKDNFKLNLFPNQSSAKMGDAGEVDDGLQDVITIDLTKNAA